MIKDTKIPDEQIVCNVGVGNAKDEILEYVRQIDADLIAIASHRLMFLPTYWAQQHHLLFAMQNVGIGDPLL